MSQETYPIVHDVCICGAGPAGLAVAARLREHTPSALFTDVEHNRYHWIQKHASRTSIKSQKTGAVRCPTQAGCRDYSTLVLDSSGQEWMSKWDRLFQAFEIEHLRSPSFFHPDPRDRDGMLAYAYEERREAELVEICGCVGKEISKHKKKKRVGGHRQCAKAPVTVDERDRKDYFSPSRALFRDYCNCMIDRYGLGQNLVKQETVLDIDFGSVPFLDPDHDLFTLRTEHGSYHARTVVLAIGAGNSPVVPRPFGDHAGNACHAMAIRTFPDPSTKAKMDLGRTTNIMVIGGGLTSAQVVDMAVRHGVTKVWHVMRGPLKVKPFDVDLNWMGKFKNHEKAAFWSADSDEERFEQITSARGGGSMTPKFAKILKQHVANDRLSMHTNTSVVEQSYCDESHTWTIVTDPPIVDMPQIDYVYFATGVLSDLRSIPMLQTMIEKFPIPAQSGLPSLTDDLMWKDDIPLFLTGKLGALRLGPGAGNLEGARIGAERVAWAIEDVLSQSLATSQTQSEPAYELENDIENHSYNYGTGKGSRFEVLVACQS